MSGIIGKCSTCHQKVDPGDKFLNCAICKNSCHGMCENLAAKTVNTILSLKDSVIWLCSQCKARDLFNLLQIIPGMVEKHENLCQEVQALKEQIANTKAEEKPTDKETVHGNLETKDLQQNVFSEIELRREKERNLVIYGLDAPSKEAKSIIQKVCKEGLGIDVENEVIKATSGKPGSHVLFATLNSIELKERILHASKNLKIAAAGKYKAVYINPDYTPMQRLRLKALITEMKSQRSAGKNVTIKNWEIVEKRANRFGSNSYINQPILSKAEQHSG